MITLEGPYGSARHFPQFSEANFDHILLIAGGVGATFILPIFRQLKEEKHTETTMVWLVRRRAETVGYSGGLVGPEGDVTASAEGLRVFETRAPGPGGLSGPMAVGQLEADVARLVAEGRGDGIALDLVMRIVGERHAEAHLLDAGQRVGIFAADARRDTRLLCTVMW